MLYVIIAIILDFICVAFLISIPLGWIYKIYAFYREKKNPESVYIELENLIKDHKAKVAHETET